MILLAMKPAIGPEALMSNRAFLFGTSPVILGIAPKVPKGKGPYENDGNGRNNGEAAPILCIRAATKCPTR